MSIARRSMTAPSSSLPRRLTSDSRPPTPRSSRITSRPAPPAPGPPAHCAATRRYCATHRRPSSRRAGSTTPSQPPSPTAAHGPPPSACSCSWRPRPCCSSDSSASPPPVRSSCERGRRSRRSSCRPRAHPRLSWTRPHRRLRSGSWPRSRRCSPVASPLQSRSPQARRSSQRSDAGPSRTSRDPAEALEARGARPMAWSGTGHVDRRAGRRRHDPDQRAGGRARRRRLGPARVRRRRHRAGVKRRDRRRLGLRRLAFAGPGPICRTRGSPARRR